MYTSFYGKSMFMSARLIKDRETDSTIRRGNGNTQFFDDQEMLLPELTANRFSQLSNIREDPEEVIGNERFMVHSFNKTVTKKYSNDRESMYRQI
jgi:hypothetical protein